MHRSAELRVLWINISSKLPCLSSNHSDSQASRKKFLCSFLLSLLGFLRPCKFHILLMVCLIKNYQETFNTSPLHSSGCDLQLSGSTKARINSASLTISTFPVTSFLLVFHNGPINVLLDSLLISIHSVYSFLSILYFKNP